ncbi:RagB/SusD family nutrient uptake outer membrane protein [Neolewinella antarctica]|uniref:RagB/SusD domain-containing protein n=1 Tax=Neolewinella antarctica TaxID=442734 RepID=A0ABX0X8S0_9BACT|nr:RagB/SusD family nutrient uptake outer membrane protein [Neolewinella antarctica]NJC25354.1 hypothetical protein [Neolewinella antarctica]
MKINYLKKGVAFCLAFSMVGLFSCTDLEAIESDSDFDQEVGGIVMPDNPTELVEAAYNNLAIFTEQNNVYSLYQHTSDEMIPPTRGVDWGDNGVWRTLHAHTWDATHAHVLTAWNDMNQRLFATQVILAANPSVEQRADALFLQGFYTHKVLDLYGVVPFREFNDGVDDLPRVISRAEAIDQAIANVEEALPGLPSLAPGENFTGSKAAANLLLTQLYLNRAVYKADNPAGPYSFNNDDLMKVVEYADAIAEDGYKVDSNYFSIFEAGTNSEAILYSNNGTPQNRWFMTLHYNNNPSGWNGFASIAELYDSFEEGDPRFGTEAEPDGTEFSGIGTGFLQGQQVGDDGQNLTTRNGAPLVFTDDVSLAGAAEGAGVRVIKYHPGRSDKYIMMRYSEAMLNKAEALFRMGNTADALAVINGMRTARGGPQLANLDEAEMLDERAREMYWEMTRRSDQIRFGTFTGEGSTWTGKPDQSDDSRVLFPIPQQALDSNPNLTQNEGY